MAFPPGLHPMPRGRLVKGRKKGIHIRIIQNLGINGKCRKILRQEIGLSVLLAVDHFLLGHTKLICNLSLRKPDYFPEITNIHTKPFSCDSIMGEV